MDISTHWRLRPIVERPRPQQALKRLRELTSKPVQFEPAPTGTLAELQPWQGLFRVICNADSPLAEHGIVHELIHAILFEEGYPCVDTGCNISPDLTNAIQHPEVFRRMEEEYGLDMHPYFSQHWQQDMQKSLAEIREIPEDEREEFIINNINNQFTWHFTGSYAEQALKEFEALCPQAYRLSLEHYRDAKEIGFSTPEQARRLAGAFTARVYRFCLKHRPHHDGIECWRSPKLLTLSELLAAEES